jgi:ABC-type branched-subunit amino acid transport system ATPase component
MEPRLLLLDEPGAGLDPAEKARLAALIRAIRDGGTTVLVVDHHMEFILELSDEVLVLSYGEKLAEGPPARVRAEPAVIDAYLGEDGGC